MNCHSALASGFNINKNKALAEFIRIIKYSLLLQLKLLGIKQIPDIRLKPYRLIIYFPLAKAEWQFISKH
jgi:hypothetical protein